MNSIDEKVSWKELVIGLGIYLGANYVIKDYKNFNFINNLYDIANSEIKDDSLSLEVKKRIINDVKESAIFVKYGREYILDSLQKTKIIITDKNIFDESNGFYIHLPNMLEHFKVVNFLTLHKKPNVDNIIFIHKKTLDQQNFDEILIHELYHYVDKLLENRKDHFFTDYTYLTKELLEAKLEKIIDKEYLEVFEEHGIRDEIINGILNDKDYLTSNKEIFARVNTLRSNLKRDGFITDINQEINEKMVKNYITHNLISHANLYKLLDDITISLIILK